MVAWAGRRLQATPAGRSVPATSFLPPMARSGGATALAPAPGAPLQRPSWGLVQVRLGGGMVGNEDPSSRLNPCPPGSREGIWDPLVTLVRAGAGWTLNNNGGLSLSGLVSHHLGGHSPAAGVPPCQLLCLVTASAVRPGLVQLRAARLGARGSLRAWLGGGRKCSEPGQGARNVSYALGLPAPPPDPLLLPASPRSLST